jgi:hypothetical protein
MMGSEVPGWSPASRTLGACIPTIFQGNIIKVILKAEGYCKYGVLQKTGHFRTVKNRYKEVCTGMYEYVLVCTGM